VLNSLTLQGYTSVQEFYQRLFIQVKRLTVEAFLLHERNSLRPEDNDEKTNAVQEFLVPLE
jgi:hypothetical protein